MSTWTRLSREQIAERAALDIEEGNYVNLGIGIPGLVSKYLPSGRDVILHSENGLVGMGPGIPGAPVDTALINASKEPITLLPGASITDHVTSFAMMRGGHIDLTILGAFQVSRTGDLANWDTGAANSIPAVGGAMDLVVGARQAWVLMDHVTRDGQPKIVMECTYPLTGKNVVDRIYTDLAVIDLRDGKMFVRSMIPGLGFDELQSMTGVPLEYAPA